MANCFMDKSNSKNYIGWFKKAQDDDLSAVSILKHRDGAPSVVCFLSQQIAEKYMKGLIVYAGGSFRKVHDLIELETLLFDKYADIKELHDDFKLLNRFYIKTRYPGDYPDFFWGEAEDAYKAAERIKEFVMKKIV